MLRDVTSILRFLVPLALCLCSSASSPAGQLAANNRGPQVVDGRGRLYFMHHLLTFGQEIAINAALLEKCDKGRGAGYKKSYLDQVKRLFPNKVSGVERLYDRTYSNYLKGRGNCRRQALRAQERNAKRAIDRMASLRLRSAPTTTNRNNPASRSRNLLGSSRQTSGSSRDRRATAGRQPRLVDDTGAIFVKEGLLNFSRSIAGPAAILEKCERGRGQKYKQGFLNEIKRLYPEKLSEARASYEKWFSQSYRGRRRCIEKDLAVFERRARSDLNKLVSLRYESKSDPETLEANERDPSTMLLVDKSGLVLSEANILSFASRLGGTAGHLEACARGTSQAYREKFLNKVASYSKNFVPKVRKWYDTAHRTASYRCGYNDRADRRPSERLIATVESWKLVARGVVEKRYEQELARDWVLRNYPRISARISGRPDELQKLGSGLAALENGAVWWRKFNKIYRKTRPNTYAMYRKKFEARRPHDISASTGAVRAKLQQFKSPSEVDRFMRIFSIVPSDKKSRSVRSLLHAASVRKLAIGKEKEFEQMMAREGHGRKFGEIGKREIMEGYIHSLLKNVYGGPSRSWRKLAPNSAAAFNPLVPDGTTPDFIITIKKAAVHRCKKRKAHEYECVYSMTIENEYSRMVQKNALLRMLIAAAGKSQTVNRAKDVFALSRGQWFSPSMWEQKVKRWSSQVKKSDPYSPEKCQEYRGVFTACGSENANLDLYLQWEATKP